MEFTYLIISASLYLGIIIASFLFVRQQLPKGALYGIVLHVFIFMIISILFDTFIRLGFNGAFSMPFAFFAVGMFWGYGMVPIISGLWFLYIINAVSPERTTKFSRVFVIIVISLNVLLAALSLLPGTSIYFEITSTSYERGYLYWIQVLIFFAFFSATAFVFFRFIKLIRSSERVIFILIFTLPMLGQIAQIFYNMVPFLIISYSFSFMILAMSIQYIHASTDFLTGISNRQSLSMYLHRKINSLSADESFAVIMLDLDNFKMINDTLGHSVGDDTLRMLAHYLKYKCKGNEFVARFGGDEFIVITSITDVAALEEHINQMRDGLTEFANDSFSPYTLTFSSGYFLYQKDTDLEITELFTVIDDRMFENKRERYGKSI